MSPTIFKRLGLGSELLKYTIFHYKQNYPQPTTMIPLDMRTAILLINDLKINIVHLQFSFPTSEMQKSD